MYRLMYHALPTATLSGPAPAAALAEPRAIKDQVPRGILASALLPAALLATACGICLVVQNRPAVAAEGALGMPLPARLGSSLLRKELVFCSEKKEEMDYSTKTELHWIPNVKSAELCRVECQECEECGAWTWGAARGVAGVTDVCWLKKLEEAERPRELPKPGVVSGLSCKEQEASCPLRHDLDLQEVTDLRKIEGVTSAVRCRGLCRSTFGCDAWTWGNASGAVGIRNTCFLKALLPGMEPHEVRKLGVVSGMACREALGLGAGVWANSRPRPSTSFVPPANALARMMEDTVPGTLFCFTLTRPCGFEPALLRMQYKGRNSLFGCEEYAVYSNESLVLVPGLRTRKVAISLECELGGEHRNALSVQAFRKVWEEVISAGRYKVHDWTVKVEPDCVFFPGRLRRQLRQRSDDGGPRGVYLGGCWFGMLGALEVFSRSAASALGEGWARCAAHFNKLCNGPCAWGEDLFVDQCLSEVLQVRREEATDLLSAENCSSPQGWGSCEDASKAAFHPFRTAAAYRRCLEGSAGWSHWSQSRVLA